MSLPDAFAFALAHTRGWPLLTGDGGLRRCAQAAQLEVHDVLWLFDELEQAGACAAADLHAGLTRVTGHPRCRFPKAEVARRLHRWAQG